MSLLGNWLENVEHPNIIGRSRFDHRGQHSTDIRAVFFCHGQGALATLTGEEAVSDQAAATVTLEKVAARPEERSEQETKRQPPYNVVLWNDDDHSYQYVIFMLQKLFGYPPEKGFAMAKQVDTQGRVIVLTTALEHAELKRDQIHAFGRDDLIADCKGSMKATIEAVE
jgi:ATP-dependent Clp protease adaptor protein ClpS